MSWIHAQREKGRKRELLLLLRMCAADRPSQQRAIATCTNTACPMAVLLQVLPQHSELLLRRAHFHFPGRNLRCPRRCLRGHLPVRGAPLPNSRCAAFPSYFFPRKMYASNHRVVIAQQLRTHSLHRSVRTTRSPPIYAVTASLVLAPPRIRQHRMHHLRQQQHQFFVRIIERRTIHAATDHACRRRG